MHLVAYRSSVVRRLGPYPPKFRSNSTSVTRKGLYKATSWGDISLPGIGESTSTNVNKDGPASAPRSTPRTASSSLLSQRLKQWARPLKEEQPTTGTNTENPSIPAPKEDVSEFKDLTSTPHTLEIHEDAQILDMGAWNRAVHKLPRRDNLPVINFDMFNGNNWTPGQSIHRRNQNPRAQRTQYLGQRRDQRQPQGNLSQPRPSGRPRQREHNPAIGNNRSRRDTGNTSESRSSTPSIRKVEGIAEELEDEAKIFAGEEGLFSPKPGQSQEEWLTEFLVTDPDPEAPGRVDPDVHVVSNANGMFTTSSPRSTGIAPIPLVNISTSTTPMRILRRHGGDYSHFLPPKIQSTATRDLSVVAHAHLIMAKRRDMELTKKAKASFVIKNTTQSRRPARG